MFQNDYNIYTEASCISLHSSHSQMSSNNNNNSEFYLVLGAIGCQKAKPCPSCLASGFPRPQNEDVGFSNFIVTLRGYYHVPRSYKYHLYNLISPDNDLVRRVSLPCFTEETAKDSNRGWLAVEVVAASLTTSPQELAGLFLLLFSSVIMSILKAELVSLEALLFFWIRK